MFCAVFKKQFGNYATFAKEFDAWKQKFSWAWNMTAGEAYEPDEDDDDDDDDDE